MKKGKVGRTSSGFRSIEVHADEGKEFRGVKAESGARSTTDSVTLSGHAVDVKPKNSTLASPQVNRIKVSDIERWLNSDGGTRDELIVAEGVVVDFGDGNHVCGPNGGMLWEREKR